MIALEADLTKHHTFYFGVKVATEVIGSHGRSLPDIPPAVMC